MFEKNLIALVVLLAQSGCGGTDLPERAPVRGRITLDEKPLARGTVTFVPDNGKGTAGPIATGEIAEDGTYQLTTDRGGDDGAVIGHHKVRIHAREEAEPGEPARALVPAQYGNSETSGLVGEVRAEQDNEINFDLRSQPSR